MTIGNGSVEEKKSALAGEDVGPFGVNEVVVDRLSLISAKEEADDRGRKTDGGVSMREQADEGDTETRHAD